MNCADHRATVVNLYLVASPLQYLAARAVADHFEASNRQVLVWYKPGVGPVVRQEDWDAAAYMPFPRFHPLPGLWGVQRRLVENIRLVSSLVGACREIRLHSAVFDTEAVNYFLRGLPLTCGASSVTGRILPDGIISTRRYPLGLIKLSTQHFRRLRRLASPLLNYWCFAGDRTGADAPFCDRIYVLQGLPHEYPPEKTVELSPLVHRDATATFGQGKRALVIGQPLAAVGLLSRDDLEVVTRQISQWLRDEGFTAVEYKGHPKDPNCELSCPEYTKLELSEPLETWLARTHYDAVVGVRSSALLFARQLYPAATQVRAVGWEMLNFKSPAERADMQKLFTSLGIDIV